VDQKTQEDRVGTDRRTTTTCARCGLVQDGSPPLTWTCSVENGSRVYFCDDCARTHIRSIEGRIDSAWW
jgi:hypothetical protein